MIKITLMIILFVLLMLPHKNKIIKKMQDSNILQNKREQDDIMNKETTGVDRSIFSNEDSMSYMGNFESEPLPYKRLQINPLPDNMIIDDRDTNLRQLKREHCFSN